MRATLRLLPFLVAISHAGEPIRFDAATGPDGREVSLHGYVWDHEEEIARLVDLPSLGKDGQTLGDALASLGAVSGCGVSMKEGKGLLSSKPGENITLDADSAPTTAVLMIHDGKLSVRAKASLPPGELATATHAIEAGPLLVEKHRPVEGLNADTFGRRTILLASDSGDFAILYVPSTTDAGLANILTEKHIFPRFEVATATVLAGGLQSALWCSREGSIPLYLREVNPVSVALAILPKQDHP